MSDMNDGIEPEAPPPDVAVTGEGENAGDEPEAATPDTPVTGEGENAGDEPEKPLGSTVVTADWDNAGLEKVGPSELSIHAEWDNVGLRDVGPSDLRITPDWTNAGLQSVGPMGSALIPASPHGVGQDIATGVVFFTMTLDVVDLGYWTKISGLGMAIATTDRGDSAMTFFQHHLPGHLTYDKITLERPITPNSANIMNWFSAYHMLPIPTAAQICCVDQTGSVIMSWDMLGVTPIAWKGPSFDAASTSNPAMEQLTIQHQGFM